MLFKHNSYSLCTYDTHTTFLVRTLWYWAPCNHNGDDDDDVGITLTYKFDFFGWALAPIPSLPTAPATTFDEPAASKSITYNSLFIESPIRATPIATTTTTTTDIIVKTTRWSAE